MACTQCARPASSVRLTRELGRRAWPAAGLLVQTEEQASKRGQANKWRASERANEWHRRRRRHFSTTPTTVARSVACYQRALVRADVTQSSSSSSSFFIVIIIAFSFPFSFSCSPSTCRASIRFVSLAWRHLLAQRASPKHSHRRLASSRSEKRLGGQVGPLALWRRRSRVRRTRGH